MRKTVLVLAAVAICTANTVTAVLAQSLDVVGFDGKSASVSLDTLERRTVVTEDRGLRVEFQGVALRDGQARWIRQVNNIEVRQLRRRPETSRV